MKGSKKYLLKYSSNKKLFQKSLLWHALLGALNAPIYSDDATFASNPIHYSSEKNHLSIQYPRLKAKHPTRHIVNEGETFYKVASRFLENPGNWPVLWKNGGNFTPPTDLRPGDILELTITNHTPGLKLIRNDEVSNISNTREKTAIFANAVPVQNYQEAHVQHVSYMLVPVKSLHSNRTTEFAYVPHQNERVHAGFENENNYAYTYKKKPAYQYDSNRHGNSMDSIKYHPQFELSLKAGNQRGIARSGFVFPIAQKENSLVHVTIIGMADTKSAFEGNLGIGYRHITANNIFGAYAFYDLRRTAQHNLLQQATLGAEWFRDYLEFRANVYLPNIRKFKIADEFYVSSNFNGHSTAIITSNQRTHYERALRGFDVEAGAVIPGFDQLSAHVAYYRFGLKGIKPRNGIRSRAALKLNSWLALEGEVSYDPVRKLSYFGGAKISWNLGESNRYRQTTLNLTRLERKMTSLPVRDIDIVGTVAGEVVQEKILDKKTIDTEAFLIYIPSPDKSKPGVIFDPINKVLIEPENATNLVFDKDKFQGVVAWNMDKKTFEVLMQKPKASTTSLADSMTADPTSILRAQPVSASTYEHITHFVDSLSEECDNLDVIHDTVLNLDQSNLPTEKVAIFKDKLIQKAQRVAEEATKAEKSIPLFSTKVLVKEVPEYQSQVTEGSGELSIFEARRRLQNALSYLLESAPTPNNTQNIVSTKSRSAIQSINKKVFSETQERSEAPTPPSAPKQIQKGNDSVPVPPPLDTTTIPASNTKPNLAGLLGEIQNPSAAKKASFKKPIVAHTKAPAVNFEGKPVGFSPLNLSAGAEVLIPNFHGLKVNTSGPNAVVTYNGVPVRLDKPNPGDLPVGVGKNSAIGRTIATTDGQAIQLLTYQDYFDIFGTWKPDAHRIGHFTNLQDKYYKS